MAGLKLEESDGVIAVASLTAVWDECADIYSTTKNEDEIAPTVELDAALTRLLSNEKCEILPYQMANAALASWIGRNYRRGTYDTHTLRGIKPKLSLIHI